MKPTRAQILSVLSGMRRAGQLTDGPTSLFLAERPRASRRGATQLAVQVAGERVTVRTSRLPFVKPLVFSMSEIERGGDA